MQPGREKVPRFSLDPLRKPEQLVDFGMNGGSPIFATTQWTIVLDAQGSDSPQARAALEQLCTTYWFPLYAYVRRQGHPPEDAEDLTQDFLARLLERQDLTRARQDRGRFRTFLLTSLQHFMTSEWRKTMAQKRGGGQQTIRFDAEKTEHDYATQLVEHLTPEREYDRRYALTLMEQVVNRLRQEEEIAGRAATFQRLKCFLPGGTPDVSYAEAGAALNMAEGAVKVKVHRLRQRCRELLREEVARTVSRPEAVDDELRYLIGLFIA